jgi:hypothetical protein
MDNQQSKHRVQAGDSVPDTFVMASPDEIRYAQQLRERIEQRYQQRYLKQPSARPGVDRGRRVSSTDDAPASSPVSS